MEANKNSLLCRPRCEAAQLPGRIVSAEEFRQLLVSHRKMERVYKKHYKFLGLKDLTTGEIYWTDPRWLVGPSW